MAVRLPIKRGDRGPVVKRIQRKVGMPAKACDGIFGPLTENAVIHWQTTWSRKHPGKNLIAHGVVDLATWRRMFPIRSIVSPPVVVTSGRLSGRHIANDVGHGLNNTGPGVYDPGAVAGGRQEHKDVEVFVEALSAAERAAGADVYVSHDKALRARVALSAKDATSWHRDAGGGTGVTTLVPLLCSPASKAKSDHIGRAIAASFGLPYRGTKRTARLSVLNRGFDRLIELGFIDSAKDNAAFVKGQKAAITAVVATI